MYFGPSIGGCHATLDPPMRQGHITYHPASQGQMHLLKVLPAGASQVMPTQVTLCAGPAGDIRRGEEHGATAQGYSGQVTAYEGSTYTIGGSHSSA